MKGYAEKNMQDGEQILIKAKFNYLAVLPPILLTIAGIIAAIIYIDLLPLTIIIVILALRAIFKVFFSEVAVTNKRVIGKTGFLGLKSTDLHLDKVDTIYIRASLLGKICHYYTIRIKGSGNGRGIKFKGVTNANQIKNLINCAVEKHAEEARTAQAQQIAAVLNTNKYNAY